ncbi:probable F-box protein At1g44080 [Brachypodium distachyon]|uniref:Uncharacterized protein n=1 Tax=Brachypodium distachyon TaxID=15368 RepID=I1IMT6_BRADI|nr:probable F-box protein At1g44080 [Brachypodium distachyon]KQJ89077.1 hypothetical protein BRADI_4g23360v3 [Brachypodium distachyon]|eukprot:XP_010237865.1 probable F-box protein At1g44080 [Brachypodium distachyon]
MATCRQSWSDIPSELAGLVLLRLPAHSDRTRFAAVCRDWCISAKQQHLPPPLPWFMLPRGTFFSLPHSESFQIPNGAEFHSSCGEWLVFADEYTCSLVNTITKVTLALPDLDAFGPIDEPDEVINGDGDSIPQTLLDLNVAMSIHKVIVCSVFLIAAIIVVGRLRTLALCRPGGKLWFISALGGSRLVQDIILHDGKLYMVDQPRSLYAIDVGEDTDSSKLIIAWIERIIVGPILPFTSYVGNGGTYDQYLVESHGALLMVCKTISSLLTTNCGRSRIRVVQIRFHVFKANMQLLRWLEIRSLGDDQALFVGPRCSKSVCVSQYKVKGNSIFFLDDGRCSWYWKDAPSS